MRIEGVAPRTWLLATVAGWALLAWLLALVGLGGHVARLPDDPSLLARLPQLAPPAPPRLGPLAQYSEISARPLFSEDRRPQPFSINPDGDDNAAPTFDYVLTSVLITPTLKEAIVQPTAGGDSIRVKLGEAPEAQPAYRLTALNPRNAVFEGPDGEHSLDLRVFDGTGGEPPTAVSTEGQPDARRPTAALPGRGPARQPVRPATRPAVPAPAPPPPADTEADDGDAADANADADASSNDAGPNTEAQIESIRKRIEQRRAQLRQEAQTPPTAPAKNP
jgi:general secretion pathway protein N